MRMVARALALLALAALIVPAGAAGAKKRSLHVKLGTTSQKKLTSARKVPVVVRSKRPGRVRITLATRETGVRRAGWRRVGVSRMVRFKKSGRRKTRIRVTAFGRKRLKRCGGRRLRVTARRRGTRRTVRRSALVRIDRPACIRATSGAIAESGTTRNADRADFLDASHPLHPWPNDHFTRRDRATPTGRRLALKRESMPANTAGVRIDPTDMNRGDGFSPGNLVVTHVPGMDNQEAFRRTNPVQVDDLGRYDDSGEPVVVIDTETGRRHPVWAEMDVNAEKPEDTNLIVRPAVNWSEGGRYIVAMRRLRDRDGRLLEAQPAFRAYRDRLRTQNGAIEGRRGHMEDVLRRLGRAGIARDDLYLAWDFTVASEKSLAGRMLQIRDDAFAKLGDRNLGDLEVEGSAPNYAITKVENLAPCGGDGCQDGESDQVGRRVEGRMVVPCYLNAPGCPPGSRFAYGGGAEDTTPDSLPANTMLAEFVCNVPRRQTDGGAPPARASLYGHGLLGSAGEVGAGNVEAMGQEHNFVFCATPWIGMSQEDIPNVVTILLDLSNFPTLADRVQQSMLNFMYLGRAMIHPQGFNANPAFQVGVPPRGAIDTRRLFYDGNSQGGIIGGSLTAVAPDFERAVLGVPAMNYSTLLRRSVDFDSYAQLMYRTYPDEGERPLVLSQIQLLWDRAEANGYAHHMTDDPYPNTPRHAVLMHPAFADHQVTNIAADVEARTVGAATENPVLDPGRSFEASPLWGVPRVALPHAGSAIVYYDTGPFTPANPDGARTHPTTEIPPRPPEYGKDPHGAPRAARHGRVQKSEFLRIGGRVVDVCGDRPCYAGDWTGP